MQKHSILSFTLVLLTLALASLPAAAADGKKVVNVNEASAAELALLPRVGPALAERIVAFREENGKFKKVEDLILVSGIGEKTFALLEPFVVVSGETTLKDKVRAGDLQRQQAAENEKKEG